MLDVGRRRCAARTAFAAVGKRVFSASSALSAVSREGGTPPAGQTVYCGDLG
jgi:hypothetical protein